MANEIVREIIARAFQEPDFLELLINEPEKALEGYPLSDAVREGVLSHLTADDFDGGLLELEERLSRSCSRFFVWTEN